MTIAFHKINPTNIHLKSQSNITNLFEQLSTGRKVNRAADNAASLSISSKLRAQIRGLKMAERNTQDGISLVQVAESAVRDVHSTLQRLRELSVQASTETLSANDRKAIQDEAVELFKHIDDVSIQTSFNNNKLFTNEIETSVNKVKVGTWWTNPFVHAATFNVPEGENDVLIVRGFFDTISGALFPDINVISPTKELFGWWPYEYKAGEKHLNDYPSLNNGQPLENESNRSSEYAYYSGWAGNPEYMRFNNPVTGEWKLYAQNLGGTKPSDYNVAYDYIGTPKSFKIQVGPSSNDHYEVEMSNISTLALDVDRISFLTADDSQQSIKKLDKAIDYTLSELGKYGAYQNALESKVRQITNYETNLVATDSQLTDLDMAQGVMSVTKEKLLQKVGASLHAHSIDNSTRFADLLFGDKMAQ
ncbi:flagellin [Pseudalkalibacillus sp. SCS-8]|uniref:flagellin n=1 Tax=Pseudalkalibacillus nanhaiensis TaxID=3115291 RepID=UPI0032DA384C